MEPYDELTTFVKAYKLFYKKNVNTNLKYSMENAFD